MATQAASPSDFDVFQLAQVCYLLRAIDAREIMWRSNEIRWPISSPASRNGRAHPRLPACQRSLRAPFLEVGHSAAPMVCCDIDHMMPHISPTRFTANDGDNDHPTAGRQLMLAWYVRLMTAM